MELDAGAVTLHAGLAGVVLTAHSRSGIVRERGRTGNGPEALLEKKKALRLLT
jgi:hypothetical protein